MRIPLIEDLTQGPIPAGSNLLVEYDSTSQWYNASLTIAAGWLKDGGGVGYGAAAERPESIRAQLNRLGQNTAELETADRLAIYDFYAATMGFKSKEKYAWDSLKVADMSILVARLMKEPPVGTGTDWLRIWDDISCLDRFNEESSWVEFMLARFNPLAVAWRSTGIRGVIRDLHSDRAYKRLEAAHDGVIDFKLDERADPPRNLIRIRNMRNVVYDGRWYPLKVGENFEVSLEK